MTNTVVGSFGHLRYLYIGTSSVQRDVDYYTKVLGAKVVWNIPSFGTRVAALRLGEGPLLLLADHRPAPSCILIYQVQDLKSLSEKLRKKAGSLRANGSKFPKAHVTGSMILAETPWLY